MLKVPNEVGEVRNYIELAINALFNQDDSLSNEFNYRTYEALEKALTYQMSKNIDESK